MFISEVIIDGFKSYATRTVVSGFDPQFNAITGLNGSGKSNILDSICFVLGISNLSQVRVGNLQELVYKQGQAGVTKATVTIVFNNSDPATSPVGYETHKQITVTRQVVIGGKNKYMINGHTVQQSAVQNLFHSVQLNVNNPHFLIMQGRITKVLNMKPMETLSMIEEAAGTRMFETKKQAAIKTIEKKQLKVEEISKCMAEEITPTLENLREERQHYLTWQTNNMELERLERFCVASDYRSAEQKVSAAEEDKLNLQRELDALVTAEKKAQADADECTKKASAIAELRDAEANGDFVKLKAQEIELSKELVKANTLLTNHKEMLTSEQESVKTLAKQTDGAAAALAAKEKELKRCTEELAVKEKEAAAAESAAVTSRDKYQNAIAGVADDSTAALLSLPEQVGQWEKSQREAESKMEQGKLRAKHAAAQLKELQKSSAKQSSAHAQGVKEVETLRAKVTQLSQQLAALSSKAGGGSDAGERASKLKVSTTQLADKVATLQTQVEARLKVEFKDPEKGFDRSRVKGLVARLVRVKDTAAAGALETVAGGKLFSLVVDTEVTAGMLLEKGQLKKRLTFLPLNKLKTSVVEPAVCATAAAVAAANGGSARLALELVGYDEEVRKAMEYAFGGAFVCDSAKVAKTVAFDKNVRTKSVTLDGDEYNPTGTLTGGSSSSLGNLLSIIDELSSAEASLAAQRKELKALEAAVQASAADVAATERLESELETKRHALSVAEEKLASTAESLAAQHMAELEAVVAQTEREAGELKAQREKAVEELAKLKKAESGIKKQREAAMKEIESQMKTAQKLSSALKAEVAALKTKRDALAAEMTAITKETAASREQQKVSEATILRMQSEIEALAKTLEKRRTAWDEANAAVAAKQTELNECNKEIKALEKAAAAALALKQNASLEARALQHKLKTWEKDLKDAQKALKALTQSHPWVEKEKAFFGQPGSDFDFASKDVPASQKRLKEIKTENDRIAKKINKKVMGMIEKAESEYAELSRKKEVILNDKAKIEAVIQELDVKKAHALQTTWVKVNRDFGSIFSMLLPGTHAKLEPPEGATVAEGLEVKVAFNGVWKESLTELSGGQRSLLALSLILSLLLFKPAPMYILDEVDAALDLSHTQNIGLMLRTHFSSSQFIVVSLKEGMFNNANVIFRTKFVDGVSAVTRTVGRSRMGGELPPPPSADENEGDAPSKKKGKAGKKATGLSMRELENGVEA